MAATDDTLAVLRIGTTPAELARLYPWLDAAAARHGVAGPVLHNMHVALEEAVMNVAMHGLAGDAAAEILVRLEARPDAAVLEVEDAGRPFDPVAAELPARPASLADAMPGGLGLRLLRHHCRDLSYRRTDGRNRLTLRFLR